MKRLIIAALTIILAAACGTARQQQRQPEIVPPGASGSGPVTLDTDSVTVSVPVPAAADDSGGIVQRWLTHTQHDFEQLGQVAGAANEPIGQQCSVKGLAFTTAVSSLAANKQTGYLFTDAESAKLAQRSNVVQLFREAAQACVPLLIGPEKFAAALGLPKAIRDILGGGQ